MSEAATETVVETESTEPNNVIEMPKDKPWIAAGFKSRSEWRASKVKAEVTEKGMKAIREKMAKKEAKPKKAKAVKAKAERKPKVERKAKPKAESKKSPKEREEAHERVLKFKKSLAKREEPNEKEQKVLDAFGKGKTRRTIEELATEAFPNKSVALRKSHVRNCLRWLVASKSVKKTDRGTYERIG